MRRRKVIEVLIQMQKKIDRLMNQWHQYPYKKPDPFID
jgi:hypothetical protein